MPVLSAMGKPPLPRIRTQSRSRWKVPVQEQADKACVAQQLKELSDAPVLTAGPETVTSSGRGQASCEHLEGPTPVHLPNACSQVSRWEPRSARTRRFDCELESTE